MRDIDVVAKKMARNRLEIANSLGCAFHFESEFKLPLICLNFLIKLYQLQLTTKSTCGLPCMAYPICLPNNSTHERNMHDCNQNCIE